MNDVNLELARIWAAVGSHLVNKDDKTLAAEVLSGLRRTDVGISVNLKEKLQALAEEKD